MSRANHVTIHVTGAINFAFLCIYLNSVVKKNHVENGHNPSSLTLKHFTVNTFCFLRYTGFDSPNIRTYQQKQKKHKNGWFQLIWRVQGKTYQGACYCSNHHPLRLVATCSVPWMGFHPAETKLGVPLVAIALCLMASLYSTLYTHYMALYISPLQLNIVLKILRNFPHSRYTRAPSSRYTRLKGSPTQL